MTIVEDECAAAGISVVALHSRVKAGPYVALRTKITLRLHNELGYSAGQIADLVGRNRTSVLCYLMPDLKARKSEAARASYHGRKAVREALA
jgi:predicted transcriptional regulator